MSLNNIQICRVSVHVQGNSNLYAMGNPAWEEFDLKLITIVSLHKLYSRNNIFTEFCLATMECLPSILRKYFHWLKGFQCYDFSFRILQNMFIKEFYNYKGFQIIWGFFTLSTSLLLISSSIFSTSASSAFLSVSFLASSYLHKR